MWINSLKLILHSKASKRQTEGGIERHFADPVHSVRVTNAITRLKSSHDYKEGGGATTMKSIRPTGRIADISRSTIAGLSAVRQSRLVNSLSHTNGWASVATDARAHRTLQFSFLRINTTFQRTLRILPFYRRVVLHTRESSFNRILLRDFVI